MLERECYAKMSLVRLFQVDETSGFALVSVHREIFRVLGYVLGKFIVEHALKCSSVSGANR